MTVDYDQAVAILGKYDRWDAKRKLGSMLGEDSAVAAALWELDRTKRFDFSVDSGWLDALEEAEAGTFTGAELADLVVRLSQQPNMGGMVGGWKSRGNLEGWDSDLSRMLDKLPEGERAPLIETWRGVPAPMRASMGYALASRGWIQPDELDDDVLPAVARMIASGTNWETALDAASAVWPDEVLGPAYAEAAAAEGCEIWDTKFLELAAPHTTPEQRAKILLNCDYDATVPKLLDWAEAHPDGVAEALTEHFHTHKSEGRHGKATAAIFLGRRGLATPRQMREAFDQLDDDFMDEMVDAVRLTPGLDDAIVQAINTRYVRYQWLLVAGCPSAKVLKAAVALISKWPRSEPYEKSFAVKAMQQMPPEAAEYLITVPIAKYPHRDVVAIGLAATGNPIAVPRLVELFGDGSAAVREAAVAGLVKIGLPSLDAVAEALRSRKKAFRLCAADVLAGLEPTEDVRALAATALEKEKTADVRTVLEGVASAAPLGGPDPAAQLEAIREVLSEQDAQAFGHIAWALRNLEEGEEPPDLAAAFAAHGEAFLVGAGDKLRGGWYPELDGPAWVKIVEACPDEHRPLADVLSLAMLGRIRPYASHEEPARLVLGTYTGDVRGVREAWEDTDRHWAGLLAGWLAEHDPGAGDYFASRLAHRDRKLQRRASEALRYVDGARELMHTALGAKAAAARQAAATYLQDDPHSDSVEPLRTALANEKSAKVARLVAGRVVRLRVPVQATDRGAARDGGRSRRARRPPRRGRVRAARARPAAPPLAARHAAVRWRDGLGHGPPGQGGFGAARPRAARGEPPGRRGQGAAGGAARPVRRHQGSTHRLGVVRDHLLRGRPGDRRARSALGRDGTRRQVVRGGLHTRDPDPPRVHAGPAVDRPLVPQGAQPRSQVALPGSPRTHRGLTRAHA